jgi:hypothetical protein
LIEKKEDGKKKKKNKMPNIVLDDMCKSMPIDVWITLTDNA